MARQRKLSLERKAFINGLIENYKPETAQDVQDMLKDLLGDTLKGPLESVIENELGYSKYDYANKDTGNSRNGYSKKNVVSSMGEISFDIPRDRNGELEPQIVKKHQTDISNIEDQVLSMYANGMTTRDISYNLKTEYGVDASVEERLAYKDKFITANVFQWECENNISDEKLSSLRLSKYAHIFVRKVKEEHGVTLPFTYIGVGTLSNERKQEKVDSMTGKDNITFLYDIPMKYELPDYLRYDFGVAQ